VLTRLQSGYTVLSVYGGDGRTRDGFNKAANILKEYEKKRKEKNKIMHTP
jgi:hypothetical protein